MYGGVGGVCVCVIKILQHKVDFPVLGVSFIMGRTPQTISKLFQIISFVCCVLEILWHKVDFLVIGVTTISFL